MNTKKLVSYVLESAIGTLAEGTVLQCDEEKGNALVSAGIAREASEDDLAGGEEGDEDMKDEGDDPEQVNDALKGLDIENVVIKATEKGIEKAVSKVKRPAFAGMHAGGSDLIQTGGFKSMGDAAFSFIQSRKGNYDATRKFAQYGKAVDMRAKATGMSIGGGSGHQGGDLVPQQWADELFKLSFANVPNLLEMMTRFEMRNQVENIPSWVQTAGAAGVQAAVIAEATSITATVGVTANVQLSLKKGTILVNTSDELMRFNSYNLESLIKSIAPERLQFLTNGDVVAGSNNNVNLLNNASGVTVIAETAGRINYNDVTKMDASLWDSFDGEAVWLCNRSTLPELYSLSFPNRSGTTPIPAWATGGFGDLLGPKPKGTLLGKPVYTVENIPGLGSRGALILWHPKSCAYGTSGLVADYTNALYFDLAQDSFRFLYYYSSANLLTSKYTRADGSFASNIITLSAGSTSSS